MGTDVSVVEINAKINSLRDKIQELRRHL